MRVKFVQVLLILCFGWVLWPASGGMAQGPGDALVTVVSLDEQGNPWRQGIGILVSKEGGVLTSVSILADSRAAVVRTAGGGLHVVRAISLWDSLQNLAFLEIEPGEDKLKAVAMASQWRPPEKVRVGIRQKNGAHLREADLTKTLAFSPRLVLFKLEPGDLEAEPGSPVINRRGELVGMLHTFTGDLDKRQAYRFYLGMAKENPRPKKDGQKDEITWPAAPLKRFCSPGIQDFWDGVGASVREDWGAAEQHFSAPLAQPGSLPEAYYGRGVARYHLGDWDGAVQDLQEATRRLSGYALAFLWLGKTRERQGQRLAAERDYARAAELAPDLTEAWFRLGELAYQRGELARAKECLEKAKDELAYGAKSWWYLGNIALKEQRPRDGLEAFTQATKLEPGFFQAYLDGGKLLLDDLGEPNEAAVWLKEAVKLKPGQALPRYYLALACLTSWNRAGAWEQYFVLRDMAPNLASSLAMTLERRL